MTLIQQETELTAKLTCFTEKDPFASDPKLYGFNEQGRLLGTFAFDEEEFQMYSCPSSAVELLSQSQYAVFRSSGQARSVGPDGLIDESSNPRRVMVCVGFGVEGRDFDFASTLIFEDDQDNPITTDEAQGQLRTWLSILFIQGIERRLSR